MAEKRTDDLKAMRLKAMMNIDPLGHAMVPKFCTPSSVPFYGLASAGSSYTAASLSAGTARSDFSALHDPLARHPVSAGTTSRASSFSSLPLSVGCFVHPKPIKVEPHNKRASFDETSSKEVEQGNKQEAARQLEAARLQEEDKRQEACEALQALKAEPSAHEEGEEMDTSAPTSATVEKSPVKKEQGDSSEDTPMEEGEKDETSQESKDPEERTLEASEEEPSSKRARNITYQCCSCEYTSSVLSNLTSHLESEHGLTDYELIKSLLSCLGDIGA